MYQLDDDAMLDPVEKDHYWMLKTTAAN